MTHPSSHQQSGPGHERRDIDVSAVLRFGWGLLALIVVTFIASWAIELALDRREAALSPPASPLAGEYGPNEPPAPRLQVDPLGDLARQRAAEATILNGYGWVDRKGGVVRIPIEQAMKMLVEQRAGLPGGAAATGGTSGRGEVRP